MIKENFNDFLEERDNELNELALVKLEKLSASMVYSQFGSKTNPKMRDELIRAITIAIEPVLTKYDYKKI